VLVKHGTRFKYLDTQTNSFLGTFKPVPESRVLRQCAYELPDRSRGLDRFLLRTFCSPSRDTRCRVTDGDRLIANQDVCSDEIPVAQFRVLASLLLDNMSQHPFLLASLAPGSLDLSTHEAWAVVSQVLREAGPSDGSVDRQAHSLLTQQIYGQ
jgi:hypothetical protein